MIPLFFVTSVFAKLGKEEVVKLETESAQCYQDQYLKEIYDFSDEIAKLMTQQLCGDPYHFICDETLRKSKKKKLFDTEEIEKKYKEVARLKLAKKYGLSKNISIKKLLIKMEMMQGSKEKFDPDKWTEAKHEFVGEVARLVGEDLAGFPQLAKLEGEEAKKLLYQAILSTSSFPKELKKQLISNVEKVNIIDAAQTAFILASKWKEKASDSNIYQHLFKYCGPNGLASNALLAYETIKKDDKKSKKTSETDEKEVSIYPNFYFCPGMHIVSQGVTRAGVNSSRDSNIWINTHELAHSIDNQAFKEIYDNYFSCIDINYGQQIDIKKDLLKAKTKPEKINEMLWAQKREIIADYWASKVMTLRIGQAKNQQDRLKIAIQSAMAFCEKTSQPLEEIDPHPQVSFRMNKLIFGSDEIRKALHCPKQKIEGPDCHL